ncbi:MULTISPECIES: hypothetical protein [Klebsiella/Raoultella group]|uniref:hypothetical protein n=1 Tax=Klebsiella/Raoultella group TaxID=2890311 RepID=UPI001D10833B|nr:hypothetical protein [Klebsiella quasipneumoniae]
MTTDITELAPAMKEAAEKYRLTLEAYRNNPRDYDTVVAWDEATSEFMELVDSDELNIISGLVEALEKAQKRIGELESFRTAYMEWSDKTDWARADKRFDVLKPWGKHLADVLKEYIEHLESRTVTAAASDVLAERQRQVTAEGWTAERDDGYQNSELADAAACYAIHAHNQGFSTPAHWPWSPDWWKQTSPRRDLVKAGALILAEIERLDRAAGIKWEAE